MTTTMMNPKYPVFNNEDIAPLTQQEMLKLFKERSNPAARDRLITGNIRLVYYLVNSYYYETTAFTTEDLVSTGFVGLIKAVDTYNPSSNCKFATYAATCIRNEIGMALRKVVKRQSEVTFSDIIAHVSDDTDGNEEDILGTMTRCDTSTDPYEIVCHSDLQQYAVKAIETLTDSEQKVLKLYYGIEYPRSYNQREIAKAMNISQSYVSRLIKTAVKKLKAYMLSASES